jgi:hypothetical protein
MIWLKMYWNVYVKKLTAAAVWRSYAMMLRKSSKNAKK